MAGFSIYTIYFFYIYKINVFLLNLPFKEKEIQIKVYKN